MAHLKIFKGNSFLSEIELDPTQTYLGGRAEDCQIKLDAEPGVSRQHFRLSFANGWKLEVLSRFGELYVEEQKQSSLPLKNGLKFSVPPYEFEFTEMAAEASAQAEERTMVARLPSTAYLKLVDQRGRVRQVFRLEGEAWVAGRETTCAVFVDNPKVSRKQFEVYREGDQYFARDLGSANGTFLNGKPLSPEQWTPLQSSDVLTIVDWTLHFELRDVGFDQRVEDVDPALRAPVLIEEPRPTDMPPLDPSPYQHIPMAYEYPPPPMPMPPPASFVQPSLMDQIRSQMTPVRVAIVALIVLGLAMNFMGDNGGNKKQDSAASAKTPFEKLSPEDQKVVTFTYSLAKQLLMQGKYENARQELQKLHAKISQYEDSKEVEKWAEEGIRRKDEMAKVEAEQKTKMEMEEKVQKQVQICRSQTNDNSTILDVENCLSPVLALNPEHPMIASLKADVERKITDRQIRETKQKEYAEQVRKQQALFDRAQSTVHKGHPREAIKELRVVLASHLPDPKNLKTEAKRQIASLEQKMAAEQAQYESQADQFHKDGKLRDAILVLRKALAINPDNEVVKGRIDSFLVELRKQMQTYYQEGILEESVGEVETAKSKWKKIMDLSVPDEEYYKKAQIKLKKYGAI